MAKNKKNAAETAAEKAAVDLSSPVETAEPAPVVEETRTAVANTVVVALNNPTSITFDLSGNRKVKILGNAEGLRGKDKGHIPVGAFGLTEIAAADWDEIKNKYGNMRVFRRGLCFAAENKGNAMAEADEKKGTRHGREPIDPKTDPQLRGRVVETTAPEE